MGRGNSRNSPGELNSNFVCFQSILPDHHMLVNGRYLRIGVMQYGGFARRRFPKRSPARAPGIGF
jgi:hypothetical protein